MDKNSRQINAWCMYDWANSAFATTIMAAVLPEYYSAVAARGLPGVTATTYWGYTNTVGMLLVAAVAPVLGAVADHCGARKRLLAAFALLGVFATASLVMVGPGDWALASMFYIAGLFGWSCANIFYDSLLPHIAPAVEIDRVSSRGYALGYLGGGILLLINFILIDPHLVGLERIPGIPDSEWASRISFLSAALWWGFFSVPLFRHVSEPPPAQVETKTHFAKAGFSRALNTLRNVRKYRQLFKFLLAFWFYNDGITSVIVMAVIFGAEIGIAKVHLIGALLMVQFVAFPFAILFGRLASKIGAKNSVQLGIYAYCLIVIGGFFMQTAWHFWALSLMVAMVQGGTQALSRSLFANMCPRNKTGEFFGFYDVSSKFASIMGPFLFATVGLLTGSSRNGIISLVALFIIGSLLLARVDTSGAIMLARAEDEKPI